MGDDRIAEDAHELIPQGVEPLGEFDE